jgi:CRISPR-associated protein (TIGR02584 family)
MKFINAFRKLRMQKQKQILLCVAGLTPQIIMETLWALTQVRKERIDEIRVITTLEGRNRLRDTLLDKQRGQLAQFCRDYAIDINSITFDETTITLLHTPDGRTLQDIRTEEENNYAADQICEIVRELTSAKNIRLHASAAGGRKTMSIYLTAAMQLFGRPEDSLSHVLVNEDFETHPAFFYIPPTHHQLEVKDRQGNLVKRISTIDARIHLADIPFIRLRGARSEWLREDGRRYGDFVRQAQDYLNVADSAHEIRLYLSHRKVVIANNKVDDLTEKEFFVYALFAHLRQQNRGEAGFVLFNEIGKADLNFVLQSITAADGEPQSLADYGSSRFTFADTLAKQIGSQNVKDLDDFKTSITEARSKLNRKFKKADIPERYSISRRGKRQEFRYGLKVEPQHIIWL